MGYRSDVYVKTTTEGYILIERFNNTIENKLEKPLTGAEIYVTSKGFYKIEFLDVKWYEGSYKDVNNFMKSLDILTEQEIPWVFIRIGEEYNDVDYRCNWTDDMPDELADFHPNIDINDEEWGDYKEVENETDTKHIKEILFKLFEDAEDSTEIEERLQKMNRDGEISYKDYDWAVEHWEKLLEDYIARKESE